MDSTTGGRRRRAELLRLPAAARTAALVDGLRNLLATALKMDAGDIRPDEAFRDPQEMLGLLQQLALRELGFPLHDYDLPFCTSLRGLAEHLAGELDVAPAPAAPVGDLYEGGTWAWGPVERQFGAALDRPAVLLLSAPRSGSTLLCAMLARHPKLFASSELCLLPFESMGARGRALDALGQGWMRFGLLSAIIELTGMTIQQAEQECLMLEARDIAVATVYARLQELAGNRVLVDKSPIYASHPAWLSYAERMFQAPRYIHLTRHPSAVIESYVRMRFYRFSRRHWLVWDENPWRHAEKVWTSTNLHILRFLGQVDAGRQLRVSYEALVADPAGVLTRICDFLEIPFDPGMLTPYSEGAGSPLDAIGIRAGDPGFSSHSGIEAGLASEWRLARRSHPLGRVTREIAEGLDYTVD
jgi:sulfotransferase family protein